MVNFMLCIFYHNKKKYWKEKTTKVKVWIELEIICIRTMTKIIP